MSEDHIKTVVIDPPLKNHADDKLQNEHRPEKPDAHHNEENQPGMPPPSWLS